MTSKRISRRRFVGIAAASAIGVGLIGNQAEAAIPVGWDEARRIVASGAIGDIVRASGLINGRAQAAIDDTLEGFTRAIGSPIDGEIRIERHIGTESVAASCILTNGVRVVVASVSDAVSVRYTICGTHGTLVYCGGNWQVIAQ